MTAPLNATHDPAAASWIKAAQDPTTDFPLQNLPFGAFRPAPSPPQPPRLGVAIGDRVLDLAGLAAVNLLGAELAPAAAALAEPNLNRLMALEPAILQALRHRLFALLHSSAPESHRAALGSLLHPLDRVELCLPIAVGDYTDFYSSIHHATRVGQLFRPDHPLLPNYKWVPIGYHGRASSLVASGAAIRRPCGQAAPPADRPDSAPLFGPSRRLDYELELGLLVGAGNTLGEPVPIAKAGGHFFGVCLVNDWSARDIQAWEYQPLGPFLGKNFATTLSPWVVTLDALAPFRVAADARPPGDPAPLSYLFDAADQASGALDVFVEAALRTAAMRQAGMAPHPLSRASARDLYWTPAQMLAHHTSNGCPLRPGDLLATGTISGPEPGSAGCLLELTSGGRAPLRLPNGESRQFLADGDEVVLRAYCERPGWRRLGWGECRGLILPAGA